MAPPLPETVPSRRIALGPAAVALVVIAAAATLGARIARDDGRLVADREIAVPDFPEISGIAWCPERGTLLAVSDEAGLAEIDLEGRVLRHLPLRRDLEDVVAAPGGARAWLLEEREPALLELDVERFEVVSERRLPPLEPSRAGDANLGLEGVDRDPVRGGFRLVQQGEPAALLTWREGPRTGEEVRVLDTDQANACLVGDHGRIVVLSRTRGLGLVDPERGPGPVRWVPLEETRAEGMTLVPGVGLLVAIDRDRSRMLVYSALDTFEKLARALEHP